MSPEVLADALAALAVVLLFLAGFPRARCKIGWHGETYAVQGRESHPDATRRTSTIICRRCSRSVRRSAGEWFVPPRRDVT